MISIRELFKIDSFSFKRNILGSGTTSRKMMTAAYNYAYYSKEAQMLIRVLRGSQRQWSIFYSAFYTKWAYRTLSFCTSHHASPNLNSKIVSTCQ